MTNKKPKNPKYNLCSSIFMCVFLLIRKHKLGAHLLLTKKDKKTALGGKQQFLYLKL